MKRALFALVLVATAAWMAAAQANQKVNLSGTWQIEYHDKNGVEVDTPMVSFLQTGGKLEGVFGEGHWKVEGTVVGAEVKFSFTPPTRKDVTVRYQGVLESVNRIRGGMVSEVQSGTFEATRKW